MKKCFVAVFGGTVLAIGAALLVLPGPGLPVVAAGFAILATEFLWARRVWRRARGVVARVRRRSGLRFWSRGTKATGPDGGPPNRADAAAGGAATESTGRQHHG